MSSIKKVTNELNVKQAALDKFSSEKNKLTQSLEDLQKKRSIATRDLAAGDESQQKIIFNLEGQIAPVMLRLEGIETLISETNVKVQAAKTALEVAKADYGKELRKFIEEREAQEFEKLRAGLPERKQRLFDLYATFCEELGRFQIDSYWPADGKMVDDVLNITNKNVGESLRAVLHSKNLRPLALPGSNIQIIMWSHFQAPANSGLPAGGPLKALDLAKILKGNRIAGYEKEFEAKHKD